jgi:nucleoid DNA-binding protein
VNKSEFIDKVADKAQMSRAAAARAVDAIFDTAGGAVSEAVHGLGELSIPGFGKFTKKTRAARQGRNPRTGAVIDIPERSTISFTAGKNFREGSPSGRRKAAGAAAGAALGAAAGAAAAAAGGAKRGGAAAGGTTGGATGGGRARGGGTTGGVRTGGGAGNGGGGGRSGGGGGRSGGGAGGGGGRGGGGRGGR